MRRIAFVGWVGFATAAVGYLSCARKPAPVSERPDTLASVDLRPSITQQIGNAACTSSSVCRTLPLGVKACGGPRQYLVYSLAVTDSARLAADAARYNEAEARKNREEGLVSDCMMLLEPKVSCVSGRCVAVPVQGRQAQ
jgi:hypothetical protein